MPESAELKVLKVLRKAVLQVRRRGTAQRSLSGVPRVLFTVRTRYVPYGAAQYPGTYVRAPSAVPVSLGARRGWASQSVWAVDWSKSVGGGGTM